MSLVFFHISLLDTRHTLKIPSASHNFLAYYHDHHPFSSEILLQDCIDI